MPDKSSPSLYGHEIPVYLVDAMSDVVNNLIANGFLTINDSVADEYTLVQLKQLLTSIDLIVGTAVSQKFGTEVI